MKNHLASMLIISLITFSFILSALKYRKYKNSPLRYFTYLLGITIITEVTAHLLGFHFLIYNIVVYNLFIPIVNLFYLWFYKHFFSSNRNKKLMNVFAVIFVLVYLFEFFVLKKDILKDSFWHSLIVGAIFIVITIILYLIEIVKNDKIISNIHKNLLFWISIGSLIFYVGIIPIFINSAFLHYRNAYFFIVEPLNIILYGCFVLGYILSDTKNQITTN